MVLSEKLVFFDNSLVKYTELLGISVSLSQFVVILPPLYGQPIRNQGLENLQTGTMRVPDF